MDKKVSIAKAKKECLPIRHQSGMSTVEEEERCSSCLNKTELFPLTDGGYLNMLFKKSKLEGMTSLGK
jgi:hypothetical protein